MLSRAAEGGRLTSLDSILPTTACNARGLRGVLLHHLAGLLPACPVVLQPGLGQRRRLALHCTRQAQINPSALPTACEHANKTQRRADGSCSGKAVHLIHMRGLHGQQAARESENRSSAEQCQVWP